MDKLALELRNFAYDHPHHRGTLISALRKGSLRTANYGISEATLVRLAYEIPELRPTILPRLVKTAYEADFVDMFSGERFKIRGEERAWSTILGYLRDKASPYYNDAKKFVDKKYQEWKKKAPKKISEAADKVKKALTGPKAKKALNETSRTAATLVKAGLKGASEGLQSAGKKLLSDTRNPVKAATETFDSFEKAVESFTGPVNKAVSKGLKALEGANVSDEGAEGMSKALMRAKKGAVSAAKGALGGVQLASETVGLAGMGVGLMASAFMGGVGAVGKVLGGASLGLGKVAGALYKGASAADSVGIGKKQKGKAEKAIEGVVGKLAAAPSEEQLSEGLIELFSQLMGHTDAESIESLLPYLKDDGGFDMDAFEKDFSEQLKGAEASIKESVLKEVESMGKSKGDEGDEGDEGEEEGDEEGDEGLDEKSKALLNKLASYDKATLIRVAYENPHLRHKLLSLI